jgi:hypothetical protein
MGKNPTETAVKTNERNIMAAFFMEALRFTKHSSDAFEERRLLFFRRNPKKELLKRREKFISLPAIGWREIDVFLPGFFDIFFQPVNRRDDSSENQARNDGVNLPYGTVRKFIRTFEFHGLRFEFVDFNGFGRELEFRDDDDEEVILHLGPNLVEREIFWEYDRARERTEEAFFDDRTATRFVVDGGGVCVRRK